MDTVLAVSLSELLHTVALLRPAPTPLLEGLPRRFIGLPRRL